MKNNTFSAYVDKMNENVNKNDYHLFITNKTNWRNYGFMMYILVLCGAEHLRFIFDNNFWDLEFFGWSHEIECQNFPGNKIPGQKISRQNIAGWKILGPENSGNTKFSWNSRKKIRENSRIFFFRGQKIPGFLAPLNSRIENSVTEFPRTFFAIYGFFGAKRRQNLPFLGLTQESRNGATFLSA